MQPSLGLVTRLGAGAQSAEARRFALLLRAVVAPGAVFSVSGKTIRCVSANEEFERFWEVSPAAGMPLESLVPGIWGAFLRSKYQQALKLGASQSFEWTIHRGGAQRVIQSRVTPFPVDAPRAAYVVDLSQEVTDRRREQEELRAVGFAFEHAVGGISRLEPDGHYAAVGAAYARLYGRTPDEMLGRSYLHFVQADEVEKVQAAYREMLIRGESEYEALCERPDGSPIYVHVVLMKTTDADHRFTGHYRFAKDITERKLLERKILETSERERRSIGQDLHDGLGQHLTGVAFLAKVLEQKLAAAGAPETADAAAITRLVNEAIAQSHNLAEMLISVDVPSDGLMAALRKLAAKTEALFSIPCGFSCGKPVLVQKNEAAMHLYRIAQEAVNNAVKHARPRRIRISLDIEGGNAVLAVRDDGVGIAPENRRGQGFGLHIMEYRARMVGAELSVAALPPGGTEVRCVFPCPT